MNLQTWLAFCVTEAFLSPPPEPAVLFAASTPLSRGVPEGLSAALGILTTNAVYFVLVAIGLGLTLVACSDLYAVVRLFGALYLGALGLRMMWSHSALSSQAFVATTDPFFRGMIVQLINPKALLFFAAPVPQFVESEREVVRQMVILSASSILMELAVQFLCCFTIA